MRHGSLYNAVSAIRARNSGGAPTSATLFGFQTGTATPFALNYSQYPALSSWKSINPSGPITAYTRIAINGDMMVGVTGAGVLVYSEDYGKTWVRSATSFSTAINTTPGRYVWYNSSDKRFYANHTGDNFFYSTNGKTWTRLSPGIPTKGDVAMNGNGVIIATNAATSGTVGIRISTNNGSTWVANRTMSRQQNMQGIAYSPSLNRWVIFYQSPGVQIAYSDDDGDTWTSLTPSPQLPLGAVGAVCWSNVMGKFYRTVGTAAGNIATSSNGINWTVESAWSNGIKNCFYETNDALYVFGTTGTMEITPTRTRLIDLASMGGAVYYP